MKILVTGGKGFLARHLIKRLAQNHEILETRKEDDILEALDNFRPEFIFHMGAELKDQERMFESNIVQTYKILEWARKNTCKKLIIFGSSTEYGRSQKAMAEIDCPLPNTIYEGTKAATAMMARSWSLSYNIPVTYIRPFTIYGPDEKPTKLTQILFRKRKDQSILDLTEGVHDYVYVTDFIEALHKVSFWEESEPFNIINIGSGKQTSNSEFVRAVQSAIGWTFPVRLMDSDQSMNWVADTTILETKYGIKFGPLEEGIKRLVADYLNGADT
jgi:nucleoside-diphosphate-sugar epimerase